MASGLGLYFKLTEAAQRDAYKKLNSRADASDFSTWYIFVAGGVTSIGSIARMRLLVVEDNEELAQLLTQRLQEAGYGTDLLTTAAEARIAVTTTRYAAMVLDLGLPDGDGLSILREMRQRKDPTPVLVLTARGRLHDRVAGFRTGADVISSSLLRSKN